MSEGTDTDGSDSGGPTPSEPYQGLDGENDAGDALVNTDNGDGRALFRELPEIPETPRQMTEQEQLRLESLLGQDEIQVLNEMYGRRVATSRMPAAQEDPRRESLETLQILTPDNPLIQRFQKALKQHLLRQNDRLRDEIVELDGEIKTKAKEAEDRGVEIMEKLNKRRRQRAEIENFKQLLTEKTQDRLQLQTKLQAEKAKLKNVSGVLVDFKRQEERLQSEIVSLRAMVQKLSEYEAKQTSDLLVSQRISQKTAEDKKAILSEKQKQDVIMFKITEEILRLERLFKETQQKSEVKRSELAELRQAIAEGTADVQQVKSQNKQILQAWNRILIQMKYKNETFTQLQQALEKAEGQYSVLCAQVDSYARDNKKEMRLNEELTRRLSKTSREFEDLRESLTQLIEKCNQSGMELEKINDKAGVTRQELERALADHRVEKSKHLAMEQKLRRLKETKFKLEEEILELLQIKAVNDKSITNMRKRISEISAKISKQEEFTSKLENNVAKAGLDVEVEKGALTLTKEVLIEKKRHCENKENENHHLENRLKQTKDSIKIASSKVDERNSKLQLLKEHNKETSGCHEEEKLKTLKKTISETLKKTDELKQSWLRQQNEIVQLAQKRDKQIHAYNTHRKELLILEQKNLKISFNLEQKMQQKKRIEHDIKALLLKTEKLNAQYYQHHSQVATIDASNYVTHNQFSGDLKDAEENVLNMAKEIEDLETEKEEMSQDVLELQREFLAWEKKNQMIAEARQKIMKEQAAQGEIGTMKTEIHRMQVRYTQLLKAQEKLSQDMEMCVTRREGIIDEAISREKKDIKTHLRHQLIRKIDDLQSKIKQKITESKQLDKESHDLSMKKIDVERQLSGKQDQLLALKQTTQEMEDQLQEGQLHKQRNLELLVRKQRKGRQYADIKAGKYKPLFLNESMLEIETQKQLTMNTDLISILENLLTDFPPLTNQLTKILNTLRLPCS